MNEPSPFFDLFLDIPHPAASSSCGPPVVIPSPDKTRSELVHKELGDPNYVAKIARFAFPEFDDRAEKPPPGDLNRYDVYRTKGFQQHSFSLQLSTGERVHGHVRRYHPCSPKAPSRIDVGRRGVRALVLLTRASGGDNVFTMMLKTIESLTALMATIPKDLQPSDHRQQHFLHLCFNQHSQLCRVYAQTPEEERKSMMLKCVGLEFGGLNQFETVDTTTFVLPVTLLRPQDANTRMSAMTNSPMIPLLRCLGVPNSLRLLSALMSERRVILISSSPSRLATIARSALSVLAQGMLCWEHLFIPVLPPHLLQYLQAPMPYLIGILSGLLPTVNQIQELGEVLLINLDRNALETRGIPSHLIASRIPDVFRGSDDGMSAEASTPQILAQDLVELLKADKRILFGETTLGNVGETTKQAAKIATKVAKHAFNKLRDKGRQFLQGQDSVTQGGLVEVDEMPTQQHSHAATEDEIYTEASQNELGEEEAKVAFCCFFISLYGDMRMYLSAQPGQTPQLDRERFLQQKRSVGEGEGTPLFPLLANLCQSQMFEQFVKARVAEIQSRQPVTKDSPLFLVCCNYHRKHQIDFGTLNVRRVARQVAEVNPSRIMSRATAEARRVTMAITSSRQYEGDQQRVMSEIVERCHEASILNEVSSVLWMRLRDSKGGQWKHALFGLQMIMKLLLHGPITAVPEASDGVDKVRDLKQYHDNMRGQVCQQIRDAASQLYNLLVDRSKLFAMRRYCANRRRQLRDGNHRRLVQDRNIGILVPFRSIHPYLHPNNKNRQVPPTPPRPQGHASGHPAAHGAPPARPAQPYAHQQHSQVGVDLLGMTSPMPTAQAAPHSVGQLINPFQTALNISSPATTLPQQNSPFPQHQNQGVPHLAAGSPGPASHNQARAPVTNQPTFAQLPPPQNTDSALQGKPTGSPPQQQQAAFAQLSLQQQPYGHTQASTPQTRSSTVGGSPTIAQMPPNLLPSQPTQYPSQQVQPSGGHPQYPHQQQLSSPNLFAPTTAPTAPTMPQQQAPQRNSLMQFDPFS